MPYMIRNRETGEYAGAGLRNWSKTGGKIWPNSGHTKNALNRWHEWDPKTHQRVNKVPPYIEVVEVEVKPLRKAPAGLYVDGEACRHCKQPRKQHAKKALKCLFEPTTYELWENA